MKKIRAIVCNHMDLTWRRPFKKDFVFKGKNFVSYAKLQEYYIIDNIKLATENPEYKFVIESVEVVRTFMERNPKYTEVLKKLYECGRVNTMFTGNNIIDTNLCGGESIIRNFLYGKRWMKNITQNESKVCMRSDAFGNSAQLPQIIRGFDCKYIGGISYSKCDGNYWRGIDGSIVVTTPFYPIFSSGGYYKYPPCPKCNGYGCSCCDNRGIDTEHVKDKVKYMEGMDISKVTGKGAEYILCGGEELLPRQDIIEFAKEHKDDLEVVFSSYDELMKDTIDLSMVDNPPEEEIASSAEMNTNNTGAYATRIEVKQHFRTCENKMLAAEVLNIMNYLNGGNPHTDEIESLWRKVNFTMFHDALTATYINASHDELMEIFDKIEDDVEKLNYENIKMNTIPEDDVVSIFNPTGDIVEKQIDIEPGYTLCDDLGKRLDSVDEKTLLIQNLKPFEIRYYKKVKQDMPYESKSITVAREKQIESDAILNDVIKISEQIYDTREFVIQNERFKIISGIHGIKEIFDKKLQMVICKEAEYSPFEFVVEHDDGSPWATMSSDLRRTSLKKETLLTEIEESETCHKMIFKISLPDRIIAYSVTGINIEYEVVLYKNSDKVYMNSKVFWDTINHRLRIAVPIPFDGKDVYEIPYGYLHRQEYGLTRFSSNEESWAASVNDYPAINWAGVEGENASVCLFNQGTPSYYITGNNLGGRTMFVTPLRSPANATYLHDPSAYSMTDWDGMRDAGDHKFSYMLTAYKDGFQKNNAVPDGNAFNAQLYKIDGKFSAPEMPKICCEGVRITAIKKAEEDDAIILRLVEYHGVSKEVFVNIPAYATAVYETNLEENIINKLNISENKINLNFRAFEIKTLKISS